MPVYVVTDSTCDIPRDLVDQYGITVVPLSIAFGDESFRDGIDLPADEFYARLQSTKALPTTSQPPPALFQHAYQHLISRGEVVSIHLSHKFSGTIETARAAAAEIAPDKITVVDSGFVSMALGLCVIAAAKKHKCDLIVMASHGRRGLKRLLLGSETTQVLTHSHIPVLVLR